MADKKAKKNIQSNEEIERLKKELENCKNNYLRALADYQNLEKRVFEEKKEIINGANKNFITSLLPFLDNLEKAEVFIKDPGLKMIKDSFLTILKEAGLEEIDLLNKEYDPHVAEAIEVVPGEKDNVISEVIRKGYRLGDKILQTAQAKVTKKQD